MCAHLSVSDSPLITIPLSLVLHSKGDAAGARDHQPNGRNPAMVDHLRAEVRV